MSDPRTAAFDAVMAAVGSYASAVWGSTGETTHLQERRAAVRRAVRALVVVELEAIMAYPPSKEPSYNAMRAVKLAMDRITELQQEEA